MFHILFFNMVDYLLAEHKCCKDESHTNNFHPSFLDSPRNKLSYEWMIFYQIKQQKWLAHKKQNYFNLIYTQCIIVKQGEKLISFRHQLFAKIEWSCSFHKKRDADELLPGNQWLPNIKKNMDHRHTKIWSCSNIVMNI